MSDTVRKVLFVCLGNSCRSPISEGVFKKAIEKMGALDQWEIDSAGLADWNVGRTPSNRALNTMKKHGISYHNVGRQITVDDFNHFDYIFGMDDRNMSDLQELAPPGSKARILLLGDFDPEGDRIIRDPYFDGNDLGFEKCYQQAVRSTQGFLEQLSKGLI